jgi:hypothetical protein
MPTITQSHKSRAGLTPWGYEHTAKLSVHTKHRTHYTAAMAFIQAHGHFAAITKDGLLALSEVSKGPQGAYEFDTGWQPEIDDRWFQEPKVFEVDEDGMVVSREVREWLGY